MRIRRLCAGMVGRSGGSVPLIVLCLSSCFQPKTHFPSVRQHVLANSSCVCIAVAEAQSKLFYRPDFDWVVTLTSDQAMFERAITNLREHPKLSQRYHTRLSVPPEENRNTSQSNEMQDMSRRQVTNADEPARRENSRTLLLLTDSNDRARQKINILRHR